MIQVLALRNFKAFRECELPLGPLSLLTGVNAAGKSSVLQALALLRQSHDAGTLDDGGLLLDGDLVELGVGQDVLHEDFETGDTGKPAITLAVTAQGQVSTWRVEYVRDRDREAELLPLVPPAPDASSLNLFAPGFQYLRADRIVPSPHYPKSYEKAVRQRSLGAHGEHTINYLRSHGDDQVTAAALRNERAASASLLDQAEAWLQDICPGVNVAAEDVPGTDLVRLSYGFFGRAGIRSSNFRYRPTNVGFGLTYALPIVVACVAAQPGTLLLLESPEAHLHPRGQSMLARLACLAVSTGVQVVIESHSDHVLNGIRLAVKEGLLDSSGATVHYFSRDDDGRIAISTPNIGPDGMLSQWPVGFFDEWDRALNDLLD